LGAPSVLKFHGNHFDLILFYDFNGSLTGRRELVAVVVKTTHASKAPYAEVKKRE
jgi:hypothetical protein